MDYTLKHYTYIKNDDTEECCICLEEFITGDYIAILHCNCTFKIHWICFEQHKEYRDDCPICHQECNPKKKRTIMGTLVEIVGAIFMSE